MIVLQAGLTDGRMLIGGEVPASDSGVPACRGRKPRTPRPQALPFGADADRLLAALKEPMPDVVAKSTAETAWIWLPTVGRRPLASSPLIEQPPETGNGVALVPWSTTVLPLTPGQAVDLLGACLDRPTLLARRLPASRAPGFP